MKKLLPCLIIIILLNACVSTQTFINNGQYQAAIEQAVNRISRDRTKEKEIFALENAYQKANDRDLESINYLKKEGTPENWEEIFNIYNTMRARQEIVKRLLPLNIPSSGRPANIDILNYDDEIIAAKQKAAEYFYAHAQSLLDKNDRYEARKAYTDLNHVKRFYSNYKDTEELQKKAKWMGTTYVNFRMENKTGFSLPPLFEEELTKITLADLNSDWMVYHAKENTSIKYDYTILVNMKIIDVTPDEVHETQYTESRDVPDGFQYMLDARGNVKRDSLGNDIKTPKTKTITCNVFERVQSKRGVIETSLDYVDNNSGQLIKTDPVIAEQRFEHRSAMATGDLNALKPATKNLVSTPPAPFPTGADMVLGAGQTLKNMVKDIIWKNRDIIR